jgi:hypothetical protein
MNLHLSTRAFLVILVILILAAYAYFLFSIRSGSAGVAGNGALQLTVEEKAEVLHSLSKMSAESAGVTPSEAAERQRTLENIAHSSSDSPAAKQSDAEKAKILESLQSQ